jgi:hypothetical protein
MRFEDVKAARTLGIFTMNGGLIDCIKGCMGTIAPKVNRLEWREHLWEHPFLSRFTVADIHQVTIDEIARNFRGKVPEEVLEVLFLVSTERPLHTFFWRAGEHYFYDNIDEFGEVVDILDLTYDSKFGLGSRLWDDELEDE